MGIRHARADDAGQILEIYRPAIEDSATSFEFTVPTVSEMQERLAQSTPRHPWIVLEENGQIIGYAYARPFRARDAYQFTAETTVYVHPRHQGQGVGRQLMEHLIRLLQALDYHLLVAGVTLPNPASVGLHEALGFQPVGIFPEVGRKFDQWHDVGFWSLTLSGSGSKDAGLPE